MDKYTFGNSRGAINLITTLQRDENLQYISKVSTILAKFYQTTRAIMFIPDVAVRQTVHQLWHQKFVDQIMRLGMPDVIKSHTRCVLATRYRQCFKWGKGG